jgi:hypothetical protein
MTRLSPASERAPFAFSREGTVSVAQAMVCTGGGRAEGKRRLAYAIVAVVGLLVLGMGPAPLHAQPDSVRAQILEEKGLPSTHSPRGALWRTAAVPGWGQYYNRQYYKIPFVYAGLAGLGFRIVRSNRQYRLYSRAALFKNETDPREQYESDYREAARELTGRRDADVGASQLRQVRDQFRRQRDLAILGAGLFYALTLLDAYVSAHLLTFDVDEDLAVRVQPTGSFTARAAAPSDGVGMRVQVRF